MWPELGHNFPNMIHHPMLLLHALKHYGMVWHLTELSARHYYSDKWAGFEWDGQGLISIVEKEYVDKGCAQQR